MKCLCLIAIISAACFLNGQQAAALSSQEKETGRIGLEAGDQAPDFELASFNGKKLKLSGFRGKTVILNFFTTWCPPCRSEIPEMQRFFQKNQNRDITILAINLTANDRSLAAVQDFVKNNNMTFPIALDKKGKIGSLYKVYTIPTSYILDKNGMIRNVMIGPMDEKKMAELTQDSF
ncbi:peroxiredoxin [Bacillus sp. OV322]|uniref:peroxiredoxin family protein n=1 Tax=Bacillus sp. OV322 TaxID=1882764 RepID=UPI00210D7959|nr:TlpA family protein disulfide reductase [Bacillus sp. OV322]